MPAPTVRKIIMGAVGAGVMALVGASASTAASAPPTCASLGLQDATNASIEKVSGPGNVPEFTACYSAQANAVFLRTYDTNASEDIAATGVTRDTVLRLSADVPGGEVGVNTIVVGWASSVAIAGGRITVVASPRPWSFAGNGMCMPDNCNVDVAQQTWAQYLMGQVNLPNPLMPDVSRQLAGSWVSTSANTFGVMPAFVSETGEVCGGPSATCSPSLKIALAGPHRQVGGALNQAYLRAFLPSNMLDTFMGGAGPSSLGLIRREAGAASGGAVSGMTCDAATGGVLCSYDDPGAHFSAPTYSIRKATPAAATPASGAAPVVRPKGLPGRWAVKRGRGTTSGTLPSGATSVSQTATTGAAGAAGNGLAAAMQRRTARGTCTVKAVRNRKTKRVIKRTYSCSIRLSKGSWTVTTTARGPAGVVAETVRRVRVR